MCVPLLDENERVIGVVQCFNKSENGVYGKKDLLKVGALGEAMVPKLVRLMGSNHNLVGVGV